MVYAGFLFIGWGFLSILVSVILLVFGMVPETVSPGLLIMSSSFLVGFPVVIFIVVWDGVRGVVSTYRQICRDNDKNMAAWRGDTIHDEAPARTKFIVGGFLYEPETDMTVCKSCSRYISGQHHFYLPA